MQSKNSRQKVKETVRKISSSLKKNFNKKSLVLKIIIIISVVFFIVGIITLSFFITDLPVGIKQKKTVLKNRFLQMAEEEYSKGFLENSAIYYQSFINSNPKEREKVIAYNRLFEIAVIQKKYYDALTSLDKIEKIDNSALSLYINRLKIYLKLNNFNDAKKEIEKNYSRMKKSIEYKELVAIYFMLTEQYGNALLELSKIPFDKREFNVHKKIIHCYIKLNQITNSLAYIGKIETKIRTLSIKDYLTDFAIIKTIIYIYKGDLDSAIKEIDYGLSSKRYKPQAVKLKIYIGILSDSPQDVIGLSNDNIEDLNIDSDFLRNVGDYFYHKKSFDKALNYYELLTQIKMLDKNELMTLSDIYYKTGNYEKCISMIKKLSSEYNYRGTDLYKNLSINYFQLNDVDQGLFFLKEGVLQYPSDIDFYIRLAVYYIKTGDADTAIKYIEEGLKYSENRYDKRLDSLKVQALQLSNSIMSENELLNLRERGLTNPEYYFKLIEHYMNQNQYLDAKREIETAKVLNLSKEQLESLYIYILLWAMNMNDKTEFENAKKELLKSNSQNVITKFNISILNIMEREYDRAINILTTMDVPTLPKHQKLKNYYLRAIAYYMKRDYKTAYQMTKSSLSVDPTFNKAKFLQSLISSFEE